MNNRKHELGLVSDIDAFCFAHVLDELLEKASIVHKNLYFIHPKPKVYNPTLPCLETLCHRQNGYETLVIAKNPELALRSAKSTTR